MHVGRECVRELLQQAAPLQVDPQAWLCCRRAWQVARMGVKQHQVLPADKGWQVGQVVPARRTVQQTEAGAQLVTLLDIPVCCAYQQLSCPHGWIEETQVKQPSGHVCHR